MTKPRHVYVLRLEDDCWYVGLSTQIAKRIQKHSYEAPATQWTKLHPVKEVMYVDRGDALVENVITRDLMTLYGVDKVRGGKLASPVLSESADLEWLNHWAPQIIREKFF